MTGRDRLLLGHSPIGPFENHLARLAGEARTLQKHAQRHAGPFGIADGPQLPLGAGHLRHEKHATVAGTFQSGDVRFRRHRPQLIVRERQRILDGPVDPQSIGSHVHLRRREMTADIEELGRRQKRVELIERTLKIHRFLLPNDHPRRRELRHRGHVVLHSTGRLTILRTGVNPRELQNGLTPSHYR